MVHYKLVHLDSRGPAEAIRLILIHEGIEFEDVRIPRSDLSQHKISKGIIRPVGVSMLVSDAPFGSLPYLEVDGKRLPESYAICRYLARKFGMFAVKVPTGELIYWRIHAQICNLQTKDSKAGEGV